MNERIDHTLLKPCAVSQEIVRLCAEAREYRFASVCVNPCHVALAARELAGSGVKVCSVVGFPFGAHTTAVKKLEAMEAIADGADELDMVINVGRLLEGDTAYVEREVAALTQVCHSSGRLLKVIVETCYLSEEQIAAVCAIVDKTGADFIKTSTGYGSRGASPEDIVLFRKYLKGPAKIKASGGIRTRGDAERYAALGCARLGTSSGKEIAASCAAQGAADTQTEPSAR